MSRFLADANYYFKDSSSSAQQRQRHADTESAKETRATLARHVREAAIREALDDPASAESQRILSTLAPAERAAAQAKRSREKQEAREAHLQWEARRKQQQLVAADILERKMKLLLELLKLQKTRADASPTAFLFQHLYTLNMPGADAHNKDAKKFILDWYRQTKKKEEEEQQKEEGEEAAAENTSCSSDDDKMMRAALDWWLQKDDASTSTSSQKKNNNNGDQEEQPNQFDISSTAGMPPPLFTTPARSALHARGDNIFLRLFHEFFRRRYPPLADWDKTTTDTAVKATAKQQGNDNEGGGEGEEGGDDIYAACFPFLPQSTTATTSTTAASAKGVEEVPSPAGGIAYTEMLLACKADALASNAVLSARMVLVTIEFLDESVKRKRLLNIPFFFETTSNFFDTPHGDEDNNQQCQENNNTTTNKKDWTDPVVDVAAQTKRVIVDTEGLVFPLKNGTASGEQEQPPAYYDTSDNTGSGGTKNKNKNIAPYVYSNHPALNNFVRNTLEPLIHETFAFPLSSATPPCSGGSQPNKHKNYHHLINHQGSSNGGGGDGVEVKILVYPADTSLFDLLPRLQVNTPSLDIVLCSVGGPGYIGEAKLQVMALEAIRFLFAEYVFAPTTASASNTATNHKCIDDNDDDDENDSSGGGGGGVYGCAGIRHYYTDAAMRHIHRRLPSPSPSPSQKKKKQTTTAAAATKGGGTVAKDNHYFLYYNIQHALMKIPTPLAPHLVKSATTTTTSSSTTSSTKSSNTTSKVQLLFPPLCTYGVGGHTYGGTVGTSSDRQTYGPHYAHNLLHVVAATVPCVVPDVLALVHFQGAERLLSLLPTTTTSSTIITGAAADDGEAAKQKKKIQKREAEEEAAALKLVEALVESSKQHLLLQPQAAAATTGSKNNNNQKNDNDNEFGMERCVPYYIPTTTNSSSTSSTTTIAAPFHVGSLFLPLQMLYATTLEPVVGGTGSNEKIKKKEDPPNDILLLFGQNVFHLCRSVAVTESILLPLLHTQRKLLLQCLEKYDDRNEKNNNTCPSDDSFVFNMTANTAAAAAPPPQIPPRLHDILTSYARYYASEKQRLVDHCHKHNNNNSTKNNTTATTAAPASVDGPSALFAVGQTVCGDRFVCHGRRFGAVKDINNIHDDNDLAGACSSSSCAIM